MPETTDCPQSFESDDISLSFIERMKKASKEKEVLQLEHNEKKKAEADDILQTVDNFVNNIANTEVLTSKFVESIHKTHSRRKVVELFSFNTNPENGDQYNKDINSATIEGKTYPTKYILNESYLKLTNKHFPERSKSLKELLNSHLQSEEFNKGVDIETNEKLIPCVFVYKKSNSKFKNGIYVSRDGIDYNNNYTPPSKK